jgi:hypothetical protein
MILNLQGEIKIKMTIMTKWFGRKVKGKALENLAKLFDVNLHRDFKAYNGWSQTNIHAKVHTKFQENSLKLTAYFHSDQVHCGKNIFGNFVEKDYRPGICFEKIVEIPYEKLSEAKLKCY